MPSIFNSRNTIKLTLFAALGLSMAAPSWADIPRFLRDDALVDVVNQGFSNTEKRLQELEQQDVAQASKLEALRQDLIKLRQSVAALAATQEQSHNAVSAHADQADANNLEAKQAIAQLRTDTEAAVSAIRGELEQSHASPDEEGASQEDQPCDGDDTVDIELKGSDPFTACVQEQELYDQAKSAFDAKRWPDSIWLFTTLLNDYKSTGYGAAANFYLGSSLLESGSFASAQVVVSRFKRSFPDRTEIQSLEERLAAMAKRDSRAAARPRHPVKPKRS